jgi:WD40 repeat protein
MCFSPDGETLASASEDRIVRLWEVSSGMELRQFEAPPVLGHPQGQVCCMAFSPDGKTLALGGTDKTVRLWEAASGKETGKFQGFADRVSCLAFSPTGSTFAAGSWDGTVRLWDLKTQAELRRPEGTFTRVLCLAFSPDGKKLVAGGVQKNWLEEYGGRIWDAASGKEAVRFRGVTRDGAASLAFSRDGKILATGSHNLIRLWNAATGEELLPFGGHTTDIWMLSFSPDGKQVISGSPGDSIIHVWGPTSGREFRQLVLPPREGLYSFALSPDGKILVTGCTYSIIFWDFATGKELGRIKEVGDTVIGLLALSPNGKTLAWDDEKEIRVVEVPTGKELLRLPGHEQRLSSITYSPDAKTLASLRWDARRLQPVLRLSDSATGKELRHWRSGERVSGGRLAFANPRTLAMWHYGGPTYLWNLKTGKEISRFGPDCNMGAVGFSPDGKLMASWDNRNDRFQLVRVWEIASQTEICRFERRHQSAFAFSHDCRRLVSGASDTTALVWDLPALVNDQLQQSTELTPQNLNQLWNDLSESHTPTAYRAIWTLSAGAEKSLPLLRSRLKPVAPADSKQISQLIADLDNSNFQVREKATDELGRLGELVELTLQKALEQKPSEEASDRLQLLLDKLAQREKSPQRLREIRAIQALEYIGTPEAQSILSAIAKGAPEAFLSQDAAASLARLEARAPAKH